MSWYPLLLTLQLIAVSVAIAAAIGIVGAWAATVLQSFGWIGRWVATIFLFAMVAVVATPLVLHATAWEATAGKFGWATMTQTGARVDSTGAYNWFGGLLASGWIHGAYGSAIVALATWFGTNQTNQAMLQQSRLDFGPTARWWKIRLPMASPWVVAALIATALVASSEMTVVDLYGYRTIADEFYLDHAINPSITKIVWTCILPLALATALSMWVFVSRRRLMTFQASAGRNPPERNSVAIGLLSLLIASGVLALIALVPLAGLLIKMGHLVSVENGQVKAALSVSAGWGHLMSAPRLFFAEYAWTAIIGISTGVFSVLVAWPLAMLGRRRLRYGQWFDMTTVLLFAVPGPVIGLSVVRFFQLPMPGFRVLYGQSIVPLVLALSVRSVPVAYWMLRTGYRGISDQVLDSAYLDLSPWRRWWQVDRSLIGRTAIIALFASSVFASGDVPATLPVIPPGVTTVGTRLFELLHSGARYQEAALATWYVGMIMLIAAMGSVGRPGRR